MRRRRWCAARALSRVQACADTASCHRRSAEQRTSMRLSQFKVLSFSCYGTLIDRESGVYAALRPLLTQGGVTLSRESVLERFSANEARQQAETPTMPYAQVLFEVHRRLAKD